jgi:transglutaminase-like putative cysteine protease
MQYKLSYQLSIEFSHPVSMHQYALRLKPRIASGMILHHQSLIIAGFHDQGEIKDGFSNSMVFGQFMPSHHRFDASYAAIVSRDMVFAPDLPVAWFLSPSRLTTADPLLLSLWVEQDSTLTQFQQVMRIMDSVFHRMTYLKGSTDLSHGVECLLVNPVGVCQDYAHMMIALLRLITIPARYVAGVAQGEGESHAWVEAWIDGWWQGFDPTHNCMVSYQDPYIPLAVGRDASDCPLNMGQFVGKASQTLSVQTQLVPA